METHRWKEISTTHLIHTNTKKNLRNTKKDISALQTKLEAAQEELMMLQTTQKQLSYQLINEAQKHQQDLLTSSHNNVSYNTIIEDLKKIIESNELATKIGNLFLISLPIMMHHPSTIIGNKWSYMTVLSIVPKTSVYSLVRAIPSIVLGKEGLCI
jgi:seryl-tRNA synthetase